MTEPIDPSSYAGPPPTTPPVAGGSEYGGYQNLSYLEPKAQPGPSWEQLRSRSRARKRRLWAVVALLVLVGVGVTVYALVSTTPKPSALQAAVASSRPVVAPSTFDKYVRDPESNIPALALEALDPQVDRVSAAAEYHVIGQPDSLTVLALPSSIQTALPNITGAASAVAALMPGLPNATTLPPGPLGGALSCAKDLNATSPTTYCAWSDSKTFGVIKSTQAALSLKQAAKLTNDLRALLAK